jgi:hypothetical protein
LGPDAALQSSAMCEVIIFGIIKDLGERWGFGLRAPAKQKLREQVTNTPGLLRELYKDPPLPISIPLIYLSSFWSPQPAVSDRKRPAATSPGSPFSARHPRELGGSLKVFERVVLRVSPG